MKQQRTLAAPLVLTAGIVSLGLLRIAAAAPSSAILPAADAEVRANWRSFMAQTPSAEQGCFHASYPSYYWERVACAAAKPLAHPVRRHPKAGAPLDVGNGNDYAASATGLISQALGWFPSVTGVSSEQSVGSAAFGGGGILGPNEYTLQLNTNFTGSTAACRGHAGCTVWQQFIYATDYQFQGQGAVFFQYWLIGFGNGACPAGFMSAGGGDCFGNSAIAAAPDVPITALGQMSLSASAVSGGNDTVVFTAEGEAFSQSASDRVLDIGQVWQQAEFNIIGDAGGSEAQFNPGSTVVVQIDLADGSTQAPQCLSNAGTTGETNNLNLGTCITGLTQNRNPAIQFTESN